MTKTQSANLLKLTPFQTWILADRPEDCLEQNLEEYYSELSTEKASNIVGSVTAMLRTRYHNPTDKGKEHLGYLASTIDVDQLTEHQRYVLEDMYSGSTICAQVWHLRDDPDPRERLIYAHCNRSIHILCRKFEAAGLDASFIPDA